ncbi:SM-20-related protein [Rhizobiales bacterium GAS188]|nr:SM-20-related protein [Rhizobiales bacterium GAS188]
MIDLFEIAGFLDPALCDKLRAELQRAGGGAATLLGRSPATSVQPQIRKATRVTVSDETQERVTQLLRARKGALEEHFGLVLGDCEEPQFLRYETGDFFVAHQDGNTALIFDRSRLRRVSVVIFLSAQSEAPSPGTYGGGSLTLHGPYSGPALRVPVTRAPGTLVAFRAETTHEVMPVTHGERFTIVSWYPCPAEESDGR